MEQRFRFLIEERVLKDRTGTIIGVRGTIQDITDRKKAEQELVLLQEQLRQAQKMEAIGQLAGGIAHDFNNILTVINGRSELALFKLREGDPLKTNIEEIKKASERAASLTQQLLAFSRRQILEFKVLDLNAILLDLNKMLRRVIGEDIELVTLLGERPREGEDRPGPDRAGDSQSGGQCEGCDAERGETHPGDSQCGVGRGVCADPRGGETRGLREAFGERYGGGDDTGAERTVSLSPFLRRRRKGKGTGLGLSTVYGIVKQSGGNIWVYSELGHGTVFKIYLPRVDEPGSHWKKAFDGKRLPRQGEHSPG